MSTPPYQSGYPFSFRQYTGNGSTALFALPFPYLSTDHIKVYVNDVLQVSGITFPTTSSIQLASAPPADAVVLVRRETPVGTNIVTYVNAASLKASNLNVSQRQLLYIGQEIADVSIGAFLISVDVIEARDQAQAAALAAALARDAAQDAQALSEVAATESEASALEAAAIVAALRTTYDVAFSVPFLPAAGELVGVFTSVRDMMLPAGTLGSFVATPTAGTQDLLLSLRKDGVQFGTATILANGTDGFIEVLTSTSFILGDRLTVVVSSANPSAAPAFGLTLKFTLDNL